MAIVAIVVGKNKMAHNAMRRDRYRQTRVRIRVFSGEANHEWPAVDANAMRVLSFVIRVYDRVNSSRRYRTMP